MDRLQATKDLAQRLYDQDCQSSDKVVAIRVMKIKEVRDYLETSGFPEIGSPDAMSLSLVPYFFQEANYDDLNWTSKDADLAHLSDYFDLDYRVQNKGAQRVKATLIDFQSYLRPALNNLAARNQP